MPQKSTERQPCDCSDLNEMKIWLCAKPFKYVSDPAQIKDTWHLVCSGATTWSRRCMIFKMMWKRISSFQCSEEKSDRSEGFCAYRQRDGSFWRGDTAANWRNLRRHSNNPLRWWWRGQIASSSFGGANHFKWTSKSDRHVSAAGQQIFGLNLVAYTFDQRLHLRLHAKRWGQSSLLP